MMLHKFREFCVKHYKASIFLVSFCVAGIFRIILSILNGGFERYGIFAFVPLNIFMIVPFVLSYRIGINFMENHERYFLSRLSSDKIKVMYKDVDFYVKEGLKVAMICVPFIICMALFAKNHPEFVQAYPWLFGLK